MPVQGTKLALCTQGSRGDFQPVLALALGLQRAGYTVKVFGNPDHCSYAEEFGLETLRISDACKDFLQTQRGKTAMERGRFHLLSTWVRYEDDPVEEQAIDWLQVFLDGMEAYSPHLILYGGLIRYQALEYASTHPDVPAILYYFQPHSIPSETMEPVGCEDVRLEPGAPQFLKYIFAYQSEAGNRKAYTEERREAGLEPSVFLEPQGVFEEAFCIEDSPEPVIVCVSKAWWPAPEDWPQRNITVTGNWKVPRDVQEELAGRGGGALFSSGGQHQACLDFLAAGPAPAYVGWGSMHVHTRRHMTRLAVGALREAGQRGIILGGWAGLSADALDGAEDAELREYCEGRVLFLKAAPHEWLFPRCVCAVHHGGIGTTQASLSAGTPTVVTPVFADQFLIAEKVGRERCGVGTSQLAELTLEELGRAMRTCCTDAGIKATAQRLAERMQQEDGVANTVELITSFIQKDMKTGKWKEARIAKEERLKQKIQRAKKLSFEKYLSTWSKDLMEKFPVYKKYMMSQMELSAKQLELLSNKKLWWVKAESGCLARQGEGLKSAEVGRYGVFAILEEVGQKGNRLHVKRSGGFGPDEGWVSPTVSGKDIVVRFEKVPELLKVKADAQTQNFSQVEVAGISGDKPPSFLAALGFIPPTMKRS